VRNEGELLEALKSPFVLKYNNSSTK
jgi:hypothetical protein